MTNYALICLPVLLAGLSEIDGCKRRLTQLLMQIQRGLALNPRGSGLLFGPDASEWFLRQNGLKLLIRSHEGPEARFGRCDFDCAPDMMGS